MIAMFLIFSFLIVCFIGLTFIFVV